MKRLIEALIFYRHFLCFSVCCLILTTLFRTVGAGMLLSGSETDFLSFLTSGAVTDIQVVACALLIPLVLVFLISVIPEESARYVRKLEYFYLFCFINILFLAELVSFFFVFMTGYRPGELFFDDIPWVGSLPVFLYESSTTLFLVVIAAFLIGVMVFARLVNFFFEEYPRAKFIPALTAFFLVGAVLWFSVRGSFTGEVYDYRSHFFSYNRISNTLVSNSLYSLFDSVRDRSRDVRVFSEALPPSYVITRIRQDTDFDYSPAYTDPARPTMNVLRSSADGRKRNIIMIVRPSLGVEFSRTYGGRNVSQSFDRICLTGHCLLNMYAVSRSSTVNLEALTSGAVPSLHGAFTSRLGTGDFYSIVQQLNRAGYATSFVYGDRLVSGSLKNYIEHSGYGRVFGYSSFQDLRYDGINGAGDEDIYSAAIGIIDEAYAHDQPFFSVIRTNSGKYPYDYPVSRVEPYSVEMGDTTVNAFYYADRMMGDFFEKIRDRGYFENTVIMVVADHGIIYRDSSLVPLESFRIPAAFAGGGVKQYFEKRAVSQIDIPKTVLDLAGVSAAVPVVGHNLLDLPDSFAGRAVLRYEGMFAYLLPDGLMGVVMPGGRKLTLRYEDSGFLPVPDSSHYAEDLALCYARFADIMLERTWYDVTPEETVLK